MPELSQMQRWMQSVIMHPEGVTEGVASEAARRCLDVRPEEIERVVTRSRAQTALERLAIYGTAYYARLLECLRGEFPTLIHALGEELFDVFAVGYLEKHPSRSYTLARLADDFPRYLAETRPGGDEGDDSLPGWPDFLIDLAALDWTYNDVFDGPGVEGERLLEAGQLSALPGERWPDARLVPVPCLRLLALRFPVHDYYATVRDGQDPVPPQPAETFLAVTRRDYVVRPHALSAEEYGVLAALAAGQSVGQAIGLAARAAGSDLDRLASKLRGWFQGWAANGFFRAVESADGASGME